jgi:hypothetical protein
LHPCCGCFALPPAAAAAGAALWGWPLSTARIEGRQRWWQQFQGHRRPCRWDMLVFAWRGLQ